MFCESLMNFFKPTTLSPKQLERLEKTRAKGRKHFILYRGMLGWGMSVFAFTTICEWYSKYGWHLPSSSDLHRDFALILLGLVIWLTAGYFLGATMWTWMMRLEDSTRVESKSN